MPTEAPKLATLWSAGPESVVISGTTFNAARLSGTPSKLYPPLRDLCIDPVVKLRSGGWKPTITVEIDTQGKRLIGVISNYSKRGDELLYLAVERPSALHPGEGRTSTEPVKFEHVLAFRLIKVEIPESAV